MWTNFESIPHTVVPSLPPSRLASRASRDEVAYVRGRAYHTDQHIHTFMHIYAHSSTYIHTWCMPSVCMHASSSCKYNAYVPATQHTTHASMQIYVDGKQAQNITTKYNWSFVLSYVLTAAACCCIDNRDKHVLLTGVCCLMAEWVHKN